MASDNANVQKTVICINEDSEESALNVREEINIVGPAFSNIDRIVNFREPIFSDCIYEPRHVNYGDELTLLPLDLPELVAPPQPSNSNSVGHSSYKWMAIVCICLIFIVLIVICSNLLRRGNQPKKN